MYIYAQDEGNILLIYQLRNFTVYKEEINKVQ
jgi:hypothetical protein